MKNLKRIGIFVLALFVTFSFCACGKKNNNNNNNPTNNGNSNLATKYTVTFAVDSAIYKTEEVVAGEKVKKPSNPTKNEFDFVGWYNGENRWIFEEDIVNSNLTLTAKFFGKNETVDENGNVIIKTKDDLVSYASDVKNFTKNVKLYADIDLENIEWTQIGNYDYPFSAKFEGNGHWINNYKITRCDINQECEMGFIGFFGVTVDAEISNLKLNNYSINITLDISNKDDLIVVGGLSGFSAKTKIINCSTYRNISVSSNETAIGGLIGYAESGVEISRCFSTGNINSVARGEYGASYAGGLVGDIYQDAIITDCYATGDVSATSSGYRAYAGGLVGDTYNMANEETVEISNCYATGKVYATSSDDNAYAGGLIGFVYFNVVVNKCYATGNVTSFIDNHYYSNAGGLFGFVGSGTAVFNSCYRFNGQEILSNVGTNKGAICDEGNKTDMDTIYGFVSNNWNSDIWNFYENIDPTLKI